MAGVEGKTEREVATACLIDFVEDAGLLGPTLTKKVRVRLRLRLRVRVRVRLRLKLTLRLRVRRRQRSIRPYPPQEEDLMDPPSVAYNNPGVFYF